MNLIRILLLPVSFVYGAIVWFRNMLYNNGFLRVYQVPIKSIVVGNLAVGGTGKTPHIEYLIQLLQHKKVALLSRGYRRNTTGTFEASASVSYEEIGDEPFQVRQKFPGVVVVVDEDRERGVKYILHEHPDTEVILLDDALQHRKIKAGFNILLTTFSRPYFKDYFLPTGTLRDSRYRRKDADMVVVTKTSEDNPGRSEWSKKLEVAHSKVLFSKFKYGAIQSLRKEVQLDINTAKQAIVLTGIANANYFVNKVKENFDVVHYAKFPDHYAYTPKDIKGIREIFGNFDAKATVVLTTEKDAMRILHPSLREITRGLPIFYWPISIDFGPWREEFENRILEYVERN